MKKVRPKQRTGPRAAGPPLNRLLAMLSPSDYELLRPHLKPIALPYKHVLYEADQPINFVHFIETGVGSLVATMKNGSAAEVGTMGSEGLVGLPILFGDTQATTTVYMQVPGYGLRMPAKKFSQALLKSESMRTVMFHYAHAFVNQVAQSAACLHFHSLEQRCCRWLLMTLERMGTDTFLLTQEFLAMMLGVRRAGVTMAVGKLRQAGFIHYTRGEVKILDRGALEKHSCECYQVTKREFDRLLGDVRMISSSSRERAAKSRALS
jgi:CRP-like cAMP-binding protein